MATKDLETALDDLAFLLLTIRQETVRAEELIASIQDSLPSQAVGGEATVTPRNLAQRIKSYDLWVKWLQVNGPTYRQVIKDATGVNLSTEATKHVMVFKPHMENWSDSDMDANTLFKITAHRPGSNGRPQVVYYLWSQRFDLLPTFGVGPVKSETDTVAGHWITIPPWTEPGSNAMVDIEAELAETLSQPIKCSTLHEWNELHAPLLDGIVMADDKPTVEQRQFLRDTLPEDVSDWGSAIAMAYQEAVLRSRQAEPVTLLGVIQPPVNDWDQPFDWNGVLEADLTVIATDGEE